MKIGLLICTYNRPQYLKQCLESVSKSHFVNNTMVLIMDDASTDPETIKLINWFTIKNNTMMKFIKGRNSSIKDSMLGGCEILFGNGCDVVINLDSDAVVHEDFIIRLLGLKNKFEDHIITGFNCLTKNLDGSERHKVLSSGKGYNMKASVGGINMLFNKEDYYNYVRPALFECLEKGGNWDHKTCLRSQAAGKEIVCAVPSVVQHIGFESSMGHSAGGEPPDVADDFDEAWVVNAKWHPNKNGDLKKRAGKIFNRWKNGRLQLPEVTLVVADCVNIDRVISVVDQSCKHIDFGDVKILSSISSDDRRVVKINPLPTKASYSEFMMKELANYIDTKYLLVVQHDGYVKNPGAWDDEWLNWDYVGAPWHWYKDHRKVGNGGFSLRTKKLMQITANDKDIQAIDDPGVTKHKEEDHCICRLYRDYLEREYGMKFAPIELAERFSIEAWSVKPPGNIYSGQFGFHGGNVVFK